MTISKRSSFNNPTHFADEKTWHGSTTGRLLDDALRGLRQVALGIPRGFFGTTPRTVTLGGSADPGTEAEGWMSAGAQLVVAADPPQAILLGVTTQLGTATSGLRSDMRQDTITLLAQIRNIAAVAGGL